jgi:hypothetical protein
MKQKTILTGIFGCALVFMMMTLAACDNAAGDGSGSGGDSGTLVLHNSSSIENNTIIKVEIWEGTEPEDENQTPDIKETAPIAKGESKEWSLSAGAHYIRLTDNMGVRPTKTVNVKAGETTDVIWTGFQLTASVF